MLESEFFVPLSAVIVAGGISVFAQWYVLRQQHRDWVSQQWWQRKSETYSQIVESLWHMLENSREYERELRSALRGYAAPAHGVEHNFEQNRSELKKAANIGAFVISNGVANTLREFDTIVTKLIDDGEYMEPDDFVEALIGETEKFLEVVRLDAVKDLHVIISY